MSLRSLVAAGAAGVLALGAGVVGVQWLLDRVEPIAAAPPPTCQAEAGAYAGRLSTQQADVAALIAAQTVRRGLPARAATIAIATAIQESSLRNLDYGDADSLGLFQQRPSQGWGTAAEVMDPWYATNTFLDALVQIDGYTEMPITEAAQAVQRSAYPDAYAAHEGQARAFAAALTGQEGATLTCTSLPALTPTADAASGAGGMVADGEPDVERGVDLAARLAADYGANVTTTATGAIVTVNASGLANGPDAGARSVGVWAVALADAFGITQVRAAGQVWERETEAWTADAAAPPAGTLVITLG